MKKAVIILALLASCTALPAHAQFSLPSFGDKPKPPASGGDIGAVRSKFFSSFNGAQVEIIAAQLSLAEAFDLKDDVRRLEEETMRLKSGVLNDGKDVTKAADLSQNTAKTLNLKMTEQASLSEEGKAYYLAAIPHLMRGTLAATALPKDAQNFADTAKATAQSGSILEKANLLTMAGDAATVAQAMPNFALTTVELYRKVMAYGQANNIPLPADATDLLGKL